MKTVKLYDQDPYATHFTATVVECAKGKLILDQTMFFPEEGGQLPDRGTIDGIAVKDVQIKDGIITHYLDTNTFHAGDQVTGDIDWSHRFDQMQNHSGEHIFSGLAHHYFGYDNVGFHLGEKEMTVDLNGPLTKQQIAMLETQVNEAIYANVPITCRYVPEEELTALDYRSKIEIHEPVRIVTIEGYDICACCAPHVAHTGEIGLFKIISAMNYKGGTRLFMHCGKRALTYIQKDAAHLDEMYALLSANQDSIVNYVKQLEEKNRLLESQLKAFQQQSLEEKVAQLSSKHDLLLFEEGVETIIQRAIVNKMMDQCVGKAGFFVGNDQQGYRYIVGSHHENMQDFLKQIKTQGAKGGGSPQMITGFIKADRQTIASFFQFG